MQPSAGAFAQGRITIHAFCIPMHLTGVVSGLTLPKGHLVHIWHETVALQLPQDPRYVVIENGASSSGT